MRTSAQLPIECREELERIIKAGEVNLYFNTARKCCTIEVLNALRWVLHEKPIFVHEEINSTTRWGSNPGDPVRDVIHCFGPCGQTCKGEYQTLEPNEYGSWTKICKTCGRKFIHDPKRPVSDLSLLNLIVEEPTNPIASTGSNNTAHPV